MRQGRPAVTSKGELELVALELFAERGFEQTTVDDLAEAAGIGRRTFFRYFPSKNDVVYGDFDAALDDLRARLAATPGEVPLVEGIREAVLAFNALPTGAEPQHRVRMSLVLHTPALQAHSTLRYAGWRKVIAEHAAERLQLDAQDFTPMLLAHQALASAVAAYEQWLARPGSDLSDLIDTAFRRLTVTGR
jgi:mycofactocin system transcriptional regulator